MRWTRWRKWRCCILSLSLHDFPWLLSLLEHSIHTYRQEFLFIHLRPHFVTHCLFGLQFIVIVEEPKKSQLTSRCLINWK